ncbi:hypothetical protein N898_10300 [Salmonella enterica subsp. arizonae serovar 62:z36:- str. RKS2983]|nr:hypothetical protein N898_10300 [Salmonella enterica subsp. arizonae serovar 62:z36:- str. RKS2983]
MVSALFLPLLEKRTATDLTGAEIVLRIVHFILSPSDVYELTQKLKNMSPGEWPKGIQKWKQYAV